MKVNLALTLKLSSIKILCDILRGFIDNLQNSIKLYFRLFIIFLLVGISGIL